MTDWKQKFDQDTLDRGKSSYLKHRVQDLKENSGRYEAAVLGRQRIQVSAIIHDGKLGRMKCACPAAKGGRNCEHMAALLYAIEGKKQDAIAEAKAAEEKKRLEEEAVRRQKQQEAEEARRQKIREQKAEEARARAEKRQREQEEKRRGLLKKGVRKKRSAEK